MYNVRWLYDSLDKYLCWTLRSNAKGKKACNGNVNVSAWSRVNYTVAESLLKLYMYVWAYLLNGHLVLLELLKYLLNMYTIHLQAFPVL